MIPLQVEPLNDPDRRGKLKNFRELVKDLGPKAFSSVFFSPQDQVIKSYK